MSREDDIAKWKQKIPNDLVHHADAVFLVEHFEPLLARVGDCDWADEVPASGVEQSGWLLHTVKTRGMSSVDAPQSEPISEKVAAALISVSPLSMTKIVPQRVWAICLSPTKTVMDNADTARSLRTEKEALQKKLTEAQAEVEEARRQSVMHQNLGRMMGAPKAETPEEAQKRIATVGGWKPKKFA